MKRNLLSTKDDHKIPKHVPDRETLGKTRETQPEQGEQSQLFKNGQKSWNRYVSREQTANQHKKRCSSPALRKTEIKATLETTLEVRTAWQDLKHSTPSEDPGPLAQSRTRLPVHGNKMAQAAGTTRPSVTVRRAVAEPALRPGVYPGEERERSTSLCSDARTALSTDAN